MVETVHQTHIVTEIWIYMPLINISTSQFINSNQISKMISDIREKSSEAFQCSIDNIWVIYQPLHVGNYVQRKDGLKNSPIVTIKAQSGRSYEQKNALAKALTDIISSRLEVPTENIWIHYEEMKPQDVWFNNQWS